VRLTIEQVRKLPALTRGEWLAIQAGRGWVCDSQLPAIKPDVPARVSRAIVTGDDGRTHFTYIEVVEERT